MVRTIKILYLILTISYLIAVCIYFLRFEISYRIVDARPEIVKVRDLTPKEYKGLERAEKIRKTISRTLLYFSICVAIISAAIWYFKPYPISVYIKIMFFLSLFWALLLIVVNGIKFIPTPPIR